MCSTPAHWDHLGLCKETGRGPDLQRRRRQCERHRGAWSHWPEAHKQGRRPDRTIVFLAVTGRGIGLIGSAYYAANPVFPLAKTVGGINIDGLSWRGVSRDFIAIGAASRSSTTI
jgi:Zn-dependent M28 family amino/carboxypeptidase